MSYTYLQEQGEVSSAECFSDIPPYVLSRLNLTAVTYCYNGSVTESCHNFQSGTMCEPLTADRGKERSMSYVGGFHAPILAQHTQEKDQLKALMGGDQDYGQIWHGSFARYDQNSASWKTHQLSLLGGLERFSETWPQWGLMQDGECFALQTAEEIFCVNAYGLLPAPTSTDYKGSSTNCKKHLTGEISLLRHWIHSKKCDWKGTSYPHPQLLESLMMWPIGWTELKPLAMDRFQRWLHLHGRS